MEGLPDPETFNIFRHCALEVAERILGLQDRTSSSATYGCFDRMFWRYMLIDYPSSWFQSGVEYLAWLHETPGTPFYKNPEVEKWSSAGVNFATKWLNPDGSCMEVFPGERSFCASAFVAGHCAKAIMLTSSKISGLEKIGEFLAGKLGDKVPNQVAAAALAQFRLGGITGNGSFSFDGQKKLDALYDLQQSDGCFPEYGGLDIGYMSVTISMLARIEKEFPQTVDMGRLKQAVDVICDSLDDFGNFNYRETTRNTQFIYPFGIVFFGYELLSKLSNGLHRNIIVKPSWLDDRYVSELAIDWLYTLDHLRSVSHGGATGLE